MLVGEDSSLLYLYESLMLRRVLAADPDTRWCPAPNCTFAVSFPFFPLEMNYNCGYRLLPLDVLLVLKLAAKGKGVISASATTARLSGTQTRPVTWPGLRGSQSDPAVYHSARTVGLGVARN